FISKMENRIQFKSTRINKAWISSACFNNAFMSEVEMVDTTLSKSKFIRTNLSKSDLNKSNLSHADLTSINLENANLENVNLFDVIFTREGKYRGIRLQGSYGSARFERFAKDQNYLEEIKSSGFRGKILFTLWNIIADCGRTPYRWLLWSSIIIFSFGALYSTYPLINDGNHTPFTPYYFSIVTFTTLGFGDVAPINLAGEILVALEVVIGYVMMGGLISIIATIIARRGE
ncbi:MAG TPA: pentapeptide repeat-containing protein, partial [Flavobacterium sp.]|uniref:pentapeptide repeat-containing protein n=1 Tax=Flavobacterium sp. TaxID=239 RepID=UPI002D1CA9C0